MIREVQEDLLRWITGLVMPKRPTIHDYDAAGHRWSHEVVARRQHRTTKRVVGQAWNEERTLLRPVPERIRTLLVGGAEATASNVVDITAAKHAGERVEQRSLADYDQVTS